MQLGREAQARAAQDGYARDGFLVLRGFLSAEDAAACRDSATRLSAPAFSEDGMHRELDAAGTAAQVYDAHRFDDLFRSRCHDPRLLAQVELLLGPRFYVWHSKVNVKAPLHGAPWLWHQDYGYWHREGVEPRLVTAAFLLDHGRCHSGGLLFIRGSHRDGLQPHVLDETATVRPQQTLEHDARASYSDDLIVEVTGEPGDIVLFHPNLVHASGQNLSSQPRRMFLVVFNAADNRPRVDTKRPEWVVARDPEILSA